MCWNRKKTETLIRKITEILKVNTEISLTDIGIITFTNKATEELKQRLTKHLYKESMLCDAKQEYKLAKKLRLETNLVNICNISTVHSFCEELLREYGLEIGVASNFKRGSYGYKIRDIINDIVNRIHESSVLKTIPANILKNLLYEIYEYNENHNINEVPNSYEKTSWTLAV